jgi:DNA-binding MltR family transcriptional regulator
MIPHPTVTRNSVVTHAELDAETAILREVASEKDRGAAIVIVAFLEDGLETAIKSRLVRDANTEHKMFRGTGPLATLSAKIELGFLLGMYGKVERNDLHRIREIRNEFAHKFNGITFEDQRIRDLIKNLPHGTLDIELEVIETEETAKIHPEAYSLLEKVTQNIWSLCEQDLRTSRGQFLSAVIFYIYLIKSTKGASVHNQDAVPDALLHISASLPSDQMKT